MSTSIHSIALAGLQRGMQGLAREARSIAAAGAGGLEINDVTRSLVGANGHRRSIEAAASIITRADAAIGHLIDELV